MSALAFRSLLQVDDKTWTELPKGMKGQPVYYHIGYVDAAPVIELWPTPPVMNNLAFGVAFK